MSDKKIVPINYTSRDFNSIREDLISHAKRYYPDTFKDFSDTSFGSLMIDSVAYIGDQLSFYADYQANESFLETATEFDNLIKLGKQLGYKFTNTATSSGLVSFYIIVPALANGTPDLSYAPVIKKGTIVSASDGGRFILNEDIVMDDPSNEIRVATVDENTGTPTEYAIKSKGLVISGFVDSETIEIGEFEKFKKIELTQSDIVEILSVIDSEGNEYFEVDNLSQNIIYKAITNRNEADIELANSVLVPYSVPRRFVVDRNLRKTYIQFGASDNINLNENQSMITEPVRVVLEQVGKDYISDVSFDPTRLINNDKFGVAPANTKITVIYRYNGNKNLNYSVGAITKVLSPKFEFRDEVSLNTSKKSRTQASLEISNEEKIIGDSVSVNSEEIKQRINNTYSAQKRAVTQKDYETLVYSMPAKFGFIKRCKAIKDELSYNRNLNLYVLCEDRNGKLVQPNQTVKNNIKTWLSQYKMLNDSIDIIDGKIINYGIRFTAVGIPGKSKYDVLSAAIDQLRVDFSRASEFGQTFNINDVYISLRKVDSILDVTSVIIEEKTGGEYSDSKMNINANLSADKKYITVPKNVCLELKFSSSDIKGKII